MKRAIVAVCILYAISAFAQYRPAWEPAPGHEQIRLWPWVAGRTAPDVETTAPSQGPVGGRPWIQARDVSRPTITVYSPSTKNTGVAVVVFPGGGYQLLAMDLEGTEACDWVTSRGMTCVLLKYRVPNFNSTWDQTCGCDVKTRSSMPLEDAQRALALVRFHATEWHVDPHKVGVLGFSAGGHLVAAVSTHFDHRVYEPVDAADRENIRPDFGVLLYPGHLFDERTSALSRDIHVTAHTPPAFLVQAQDDPVDPVMNSRIYYSALKNAGVPAELHVYPQGGHGFAFRRSDLPVGQWPQLLETWLRTIGIIRESDSR